MCWLSAGELFKLDGWKYIEGNAKAGTLHLIGLLSDGGVHSRWVLLRALVAAGKRAWESEKQTKQHQIVPSPAALVCSYDQLMLLMEGAIKQGVKRMRLHVLSGESTESG